MANASIKAAFERMWQHIISAFMNKSNPTGTGSLTLNNRETIGEAGDIYIPYGTKYYAANNNGVNRPVAYMSGDQLYVGDSAVDYPVYVAGSVVELHNENGEQVVWRTSSLSDVSGIWRSNHDGESNLGSTSYRWKKVYASSATISTSDEREKSDIMAIADYPVMYSTDNEGNVLEQVFYKLTPKTYTLNTENTGELHIGFIAQDIVSSLEELGLSEDDLGLVDHGYWTDEETGEERDRYGLAYEEFIALNTYMIQKQQAKIQSLEERIVELEELVKNK